MLLFNYTIRKCLTVTSIGLIALLFSHCGSQHKAAGANTNARHLLLRDEGLSQLSYIDIAHPEHNWYTPVPAGRDLQLVGNGRVLIGTGNGYEERDIKTGAKLYELTTFAGTVAAHRLRNRHTLLTGLNMQGKQGMVLIEVDEKGSVQRVLNFPQFAYVRLARETASGNFLITTDDTVFESTTTGTIVWKAAIARSIEHPHSWQALRLKNGQTLVSTGFSKNFQLFGTDGKIADSITGPSEVNPNFFAGFQILPNGNYVVTNWQGHGPAHGGSGIQVLEFTPAGKLAWSWQQDPKKFSSLQGIIVLDGLDVNKLQVENENGVLAPVQ